MHIHTLLYNICPGPVIHTSRHFVVMYGYKVDFLLNLDDVYFTQFTGHLSRNQPIVPRWAHCPGNELCAAIHEGSWIQDAR